MNISETKILEFLSKLETSKACGPDNIGNLVLKNPPAFSKSLLIVFKAALSKCYFPSFWKISEVILVFKDGRQSRREAIQTYKPSLQHIKSFLEKLCLTNYMTL